jgi:hypothetical protein
MPNRWEMPAMYVQAGDPEKENIGVSASGVVDPYPGLLGMRLTVIEPTRYGTIPQGATTSPGLLLQGRSKTYQRVTTDSSMAVTPFPNAVAFWSDKTKYMVTTSASKLGRGRIAGRFPDNGSGGSITSGNIGFIQTEGPGLVKLINSPTATPTTAGLFVVGSSTDGMADCLAAGTAPTYPALGVSVSGINPAYPGGPNDNTIIVDLDVPQTT